MQFGIPGLCSLSTAQAEVKVSLVSIGKPLIRQSATMRQSAIMSQWCNHGCRLPRRDPLKHYEDGASPFTNRYKSVMCRMQ